MSTPSPLLRKLLAAKIRLQFPDEPEETDSDKIDTNQKLVWEVRKLRAEVASLTRPWLGNPGSWLVLATTIAGVVGIMIQLDRSIRLKETAEIDRKHAEFATKAAERVLEGHRNQLKALEEKMMTARAELDALQKDAKQITARLASEEVDLKRVECTPASVARIASSIQLLGDESAEMDVRAQEAVVRLSGPKEASQVAGQEGYIWIGDCCDAQGQWTRLQLRDSEDRIVENPIARFGERGSFDAIVRGRMILRSQPPTDGGAYYRDSPSKGVLPSGTRVQVLEKPLLYKRSSKEQYWAKVRVVN